MLFGVNNHPLLQKDLEFSKSSISKRKKKVKLQRLRRRANLNQDHSLKNPRTFYLSYLRVDECSWKKIDQVSSAAADHCTSTAVSSARKARTSTRSFRFALFKYNSPCARGQIRAKSDPCSAVDFFVGNGSRGFFVLPDSSSFWSHFSAANYKTAKFSFKILCRCAELSAKRMDSARRSARVLASSCSQHSSRAAHSSRRSKRGDYSAI